MKPLSIINSVLSSVEEMMRVFEIWINEVRQSNMDTGIPMEIVNSLNEIIQEGVPSVDGKIMQQQVQELSQKESRMIDRPPMI